MPHEFGREFCNWLYACRSRFRSQVLTWVATLRNQVRTFQPRFGTQVLTWVATKIWNLGSNPACI